MNRREKARLLKIELDSVANHKGSLVDLLVLINEVFRTANALADEILNTDDDKAA